MGKLAYILDHKYSEANLGFHRLKGHDQLRGHYLKELCVKEGFVLFFGNMSLIVRNVENHDSDDDGDQDLELKNIVDTDGNRLSSLASITEEEIIQNNCFDRYPDEEESEETGNEGMDVTHFYRDTVRIQHRKKLSSNPIDVC